MRLAFFLLLIGSFVASVFAQPNPYSVCEQAAASAEALSSCNCPYVSDGSDCNCCSSGGGLDCSGMTMCAFANAGYNQVMHNAAEQYQQSGQWCPPGCSASNTDACFPGVLFFYCFSGDPECPGHVVMYIGNGSIAECAHTGTDCWVTPVYTEGYKGCGAFCTGPSPSSSSSQGSTAAVSSSAAASSTAAAASSSASAQSSSVAAAQSSAGSSSSGSASSTSSGGHGWAGTSTFARPRNRKRMPY